MPEDEQENMKIAEIIKELEKNKESENNLGEHILTDFYLSLYSGLTTTFARGVAEAVADKMIPYGAESEEYMEFFDDTERLKERYRTETRDCIKLPQGTICSSWDFHDYCIQNGVVFQRKAGKLHHPMRTKKSKRMKALVDYPLRKLYPSYEAMAIDMGYYHDEKTDAYGWYGNPNTIWDWYSIGGRWPKWFLVKDTCQEYSIGHRDSKIDLSAPEGYMWVCAARKKDIEWDVMREWKKQFQTDRYY